MAFCTECGVNVPEGLKFCTECGNPMGAPAQAVPAMAAVATPAVPSVQNQQRAHAARQTPLPDISGAVIGTGGFIGMMLLFSIPIIGWLACVIMAFVPKNKNRRNFARAMLVFLVIGLVLAVLCYFVFTWVWEIVVEYAQDYVSEATGGAVTDLDELKDLPVRIPDGMLTNN
jgi:hypothetical protein